MTDIDAKIRQALRTEDADLFDETGGEQSLLEMVAGSFASRNRWILIWMMVVAVLLFCFAVFAGFRFFEAESTRAMIGWSLGFFFSLLGVGFLKMWYWMELNKNAITREIKRLELQVARLSQRLG